MNSMLDFPVSPQLESSASYDIRHILISSICHHFTGVNSACDWCFKIHSNVSVTSASYCPLNNTQDVTVPADSLSFVFLFLVTFV